MFKRRIFVSGGVLAFVLLLTFGVVMTQRAAPNNASGTAVTESASDSDTDILTESFRESSDTDETASQTATVAVTETESVPVETAGLTETEIIRSETAGVTGDGSAQSETDGDTTVEHGTAPEPVITSGETSKGFKIEQIDGVTYVDGLLVVNKTYSLPESYNPGSLTSETYKAFAAMQADAAAQGIYLRCISGFRSFADQRYIYNGYVARDGAAAADTYSARPGHSEHQSGMALDVNSLYFSFADTAEGKWLAENCMRYGFIIRYPKDRTDSTGYVYEPWHIRYVGAERAAAITGSGLTLEEYYGISSSYGY